MKTYKPIHHSYIANAINDGQLYFSSNKTNNRIDNNLKFKSELKDLSSATILYQIDIEFTAAVLLSIILNEDKM
jgi:hypothetical protein